MSTFTRTFTLTEPPPPMWLYYSTNAGGLPPVCCIYFVSDEHRKILYIGQTKNLSRRMATKHHAAFDGEYLSWLECHESQLSITEVSYISVFRPIRQFGGSTNRKQLSLTRKALIANGSIRADDRNWQVKIRFHPELLDTLHVKAVCDNEDPLLLPAAKSA